MATQRPTADSATDPGPPPDAIEQTYRQYRAELRAFFAQRAHHCAQSADDLVQEVYERLLRYRSVAPVENPLGYLFKIAWNVLKADAERVRRARQRTVTCDSAELESLAEGFRRLWTDDANEALLLEELDRMLSRLPRSCKAALIRHRRDGYSYQQIADELQVSVNTVKDYIVRALDECRVYFEMKS